jgi:hypothetical protein
MAAFSITSLPKASFSTATLSTAALFIAAFSITSLPKAFFSEI